jgi:hypothetical protein
MKEVIMKKLLFWMVLIVGTVALLGSCAKKEESTTAATATTTGGTTAATGSITVGSETLSGTYADSCSSGTTVDPYVALGILPSDTKGMRSFIVVTGDAAFSSERYYYSDTTCSTVTLYQKDGLTSVTVGDAVDNGTKVTYTKSTYKIKPNSTATKTYYDAVFASAGISMDLIVGVETETRGDRNSYKNLWLVTSTTIRTGSESASTYPSVVGLTTLTKQ